MKKKFILGSILSLILIGCGSSDSNNDNNDNDMKTDVSKYDEVAIIYRATENFCQNNNVLERVKTSNEIAEYVLYTGSEIVECADFGKNSDHCDIFTAENEPGSTTCVIAFNLR